MKLQFRHQTFQKNAAAAVCDYTQDMIAMTESNIKADRSDLDLLFGCLPDWGLPLSMPHTLEITARKPLRAVFRDSSFTSSLEKINVFEIFKLLALNTTVQVI